MLNISIKIHHLLHFNLLYSRDTSTSDKSKIYWDLLFRNGCLSLKTMLSEPIRLSVSVGVKTK